MKKNILIALVAFIFTSVSAFAQSEKEYNMVITLQNGSTVTLGHNDVKNITFTGDNVAAEGNVVNSIEELQKAVADTRAMTEVNQKEMMNLYEETRARLEYVLAVADERTEQAKFELQQSAEQTKNELLDQINNLKTMIDYLQKQINELQAGK